MLRPCSRPVDDRLTRVLSNDAITIVREKTEVGGEPRVKIPPRLVIKNNRTTFTLTRPPITEKVVVRSHTLAGAIRMSSIVATLFMRKRLVFREEPPPDWAEKWEAAASPYERLYFPDMWVAVYIGGVRHFSTVKDDFPPGGGVFIQQLDAIEAAAKGGDVTDAMLRAAFSKFAPGQPVRHDSQTAVVLTETKTQTRCAILERGGGQKKSVSFTIMTDETPITLAAMLGVTADMLELINLADLLVRCTPKGGKPSPALAGITNEQFHMAMDRRKEMLTVLRGFERAYKVRYRPERPACLELAAS